MQNLLIVGAGDVARRALPALVARYRVFALLRDPAKFADWRAGGAVPVLADLDRPQSLKRIAGLADVVLHCAPPGDRGVADTRTRHLLAALARGRHLPECIVYISTTGVYGDCAGAAIDETRPARASTLRARRRVDAERQLRAFAARNGVTVSILRAPGIYATERLPLDRLQSGMPVLADDEDVYTNHIHADDLAAIAVAALQRGLPNRVYNACDDRATKMAAYYDIVADRFGLPRAPRISRAQAATILSPLQLSFMSESRRIANHRIKQELRVRLRHPRVEDGVEAAWQQRNK